MGNLVHTKQCVRLTEPNVDNQTHIHLNQTKHTPEEPVAQSNEMHVHIKHISKLYMENTGSLPIISRNGNQYLIIAYHCESNDIIVAPFKSQKTLQQIIAHNEIMNWF